MNNNSNNRSCRAERACKPCRDLKVRCRPCAERDDICQKCQRSGAKCIFEEPRPRKKRETTAGSDSHHDAIVTALAAQVSELTSKLERSQQGRSSDLGHDLNGSDSATIPMLESASHVPSSRSAKPSDARLAFNGPDEPVLNRLLRSGLLTIDAASGYLSKYGQMCPYSPFAIISPDSTIQSLSQDHPFFLHAILCVSSGSDRPLQKLLEQDFHERLLRTTTIEGEKSIDLLQAFVVYLAWYHFFYIPMKQQFNQMLQIAISMCVDMGLDHGPSEAAARKIGLQLDHHYSVGGARNDRFFSKAARRAYIGCYYLSATSAWIWRKPNNVPFSSYMLECAQSLADNPEYDTDVLILPLLRMQVLGDEYHNILLSGNFAYSGPLSSVRLEATLSTFRTKMDEILQLSTEEYNLITTLASHFSSSHAHEMDLLNPCLSNKCPETGSGGSHGQRSSTASSQNDILSVCLHAAVSFLETFLSLPPTEYEKLSVLQWWGLICNTAFLYRLSLGTPQLRAWNVSAARSVAKLEIYIDLLCYRLQSVTRSPTTEAPMGRDLFSLMGPIFANVKATYERLKRLPHLSSDLHEQPAHANVFGLEGRDPSLIPVTPATAPKIASAETATKRLPKSDTHPSRCPAFKFWSRAEDISLGINSNNDGAGQWGLPESMDISSALSDLDSLEADNLSCWLQDIPELPPEIEMSDFAHSSDL
ncbi:uncharacterized protein Z520_05491 [Fonsecaea multimorphosa CBS 102226]|uniref:Zn(2)-C6 fungal-type domain-containing protein n=1 Tax=Fonsecaea multimorphosa CBS 102226 TaxID=1442371 RepID=A0A0D2HAV6_9EURO|nr:uncharacterized protein Z520_05491 [Fonsecaea multimorphosa CBS 102226]KIX99030.1 hypothetical protein Z520_05491 [Fonsecaea multimorphosa CBS 102226]OAL25297.1 hypothetical protein AYO22_05174 [Fonsecaea multimorphosa]